MGRASLKLGISDSVVEVSLQGTIPPKGSGASKAHGKASTSQSARRNSPCEKEIHALKKNYLREFGGIFYIIPYCYPLNFNS